MLHWRVSCERHSVSAHRADRVTELGSTDEWMNENLYIAHKKLPHKTLRVHSARYTQCIHDAIFIPEKDIRSQTCSGPAVLSVKMSSWVPVSHCGVGLSRSVLHDLPTVEFKLFPHELWEIPAVSGFAAFSLLDAHFQRRNWVSHQLWDEDWRNIAIGQSAKFWLANRQSFDWPIATFRQSSQSAPHSVAVQPPQSRAFRFTEFRSFVKLR